MNPRYDVVAKLAAHRCEYCRAPEAGFNFPFEVEHVHPRSKGGSDEGSNLALGCRPCNQYKADHTHSMDPNTGEISRLFHPRTDNWSDHFINSSDRTIIGITAIGRATIARLRMNSARQLAARQLWATLNLFP